MSSDERNPQKRVDLSVTDLQYEQLHHTKTVAVAAK